MEEIKQQIEELIKLAEASQKVSVQICLLVLSGAIRANQDGQLAAKMQEYAKDVLIPQIKREQELNHASQN